MLGEYPSVVLLLKSTISLLSETKIASLFSLDTSKVVVTKVVVSSPTLAS